MKFLQSIGQVKIELTSEDDIFTSGTEPKYVRSDHGDNIFRVLNYDEPLKPIVSLMNTDPHSINETGCWRDLSGYLDLVKRTK